jgi:hypothetical protein
MRCSRRILLGLALMLAPVAVPTRDAEAQAAAAPAGGPRLEELRAGFTLSDARTGEPMAVQAAAKGPFGSKENGRVATIVGGAALLGGLLIGDDAGAVIAVGGLVIGLLGLWTWLG